MDDWLVRTVEPSKPKGAPYFVVHCVGLDEPNLNARIVIRKDGSARAEIVSVEVSVSDGNEEAYSIPPGRLRAIPFGQLVTQADWQLSRPNVDSHIEIQISLPQDSENEEVDKPHDFSALRKEWPSGNISTLLLAVAEVYGSAIKQGQPPKEAVAKAFSTSLTTAGRMIAKARKFGILQVQSVGGRPKRKK